MERNRESRRGTASVSGSFSASRRRSRGSVYRESSGAGEVEDGGNDSLRDRSKKERPSRRRRVSSNDSFHVDRDEGGDGSSDESLDEDHDDEDEPVRGGGGGGGGGGGSNSSLRRTSRGKPQWKGSDEVIGVSVPRKARSVSAKRLQDSISAVRPSSSSSPARTPTSVSPPSSNASMKASKRVKPGTAKPKPPKTSKVSISESEVEVAQVLYGLTKLQSHSPPAKSEIVRSLSPKLDFKHNSSNEGSVSVASKASSPVSTPISPPSSSHQMMLPQHSSSTHAPTVMAPKRKKPRVVQPEGSGNPAIMVACSSKPCESPLPGNSISPVAANHAMKAETEKEQQDAKAESMSPKSDNNIEPNNCGSSKAETSIPKDIPLSEEKLSPSNPVETKTAMSTEMMLNQTSIPNTQENRAIDADRKSSMDQNHQITQKELSLSTQDLPSLLTADVKLEASKMPSTVFATTKREKGPKFEIDLMAPPENCYPDECMSDATDRSACLEPSPIIIEDAMKNKGFGNLSEKDREEVRVKKDCSTLDSEGKIHMKEAAEEKQSVNDKKNESGHDGSPLDKAVNKQHSQKIPKSTARQMERTVPPTGIMTSTSTPIPVPIPGWPGGLPPFGYLGSSPANFTGLSSFQGAKPVEGNSAIPNLPFVMLPHPRPKRCATHLFIAHLIHYQQLLQQRLNPFCYGSAALYGPRPYNMNIIPPSDALLLGSSVIGNPNLSANSNLGPGSLVTSNGLNLKEKAPNTHADAQRKQYIPSQTAKQGAAFIFPFVQPRTGETKSSAPADNSGLLSAPAAASASMSTKFGGIATASDPQYMTMVPSNYPFPIPPSYRAHLNPQQQPAAPFFGGSFFPSQVMQLQPQSLPQAQIPTASTGSLSSQKHLQGQQCLPTSTMPESLHTRPESAGNNEVQLSQKKLQVQSHNFSGHLALPANFPPNFPIMASALGGKQQPPSDPSLQMSLKAVEVSRPGPPGHTMLQTMHDVGHNHYQLSHHLQIQTANLSKAPAKGTSSVKGSDKSPESQSTASAVQQLQKQAMAQTKQSIPALSTTAAMGGTAYPDRIPVVYSNAGSNLAGGSMGFPTMQSPPQWKMTSPQRMVQAGPSNTIVQPAVAAAVTATPSAGSPSGKGTKLPSSPVNSSRRAIHSSSPILAQSSQAQALGKAQQLFSNSEPVHQVGSSALSQKRHGETNPATQPMFSGSLNTKRPANQQSQQGSPVPAGASGFLVGGGGKGPAVYSPLGGSSVTVMTGASYVKTAANLPVKPAEQKPATA